MTLHSEYVIDKHDGATLLTMTVTLCGVEGISSNQTTVLTSFR